MQVDASRFAVQRNRWTSAADLVQATFLRGVIVAAWAQIDGCLSEALIRCRQIPAYADVMPKSYPPQRGERIKLLRILLATNGPLTRWAANLELLLQEFEAADELRHLMAHGRMKVLPNWGATFTDFKSVKGAVAQGSQRFTLPELDLAAGRWASLARRVDYFLTIADRPGILPPLK